MNTRSCAEALLCGLLIACGRKAERQPAATRATGPLIVSTVERGPLRHFDSDSLSELARVVQLVPEADGDGVAFVFADSLQQIADGLGLLDRQHTNALLVWPDSVTTVWWPALHRLAFTSTIGNGVNVVVDVHAATLRVLTDTAMPSVQSPAVHGQQAGHAELERAKTYIDSVHTQIEGYAGRSPLHYSVADFVLAPGDSLAAFYGAAADTTGSWFNPSWYMLDMQSGQVQPVDRVVGRADIMPPGAAAWDRHNHFFYVKENTLYEVHVAR